MHTALVALFIGALLGFFVNLFFISAEIRELKAKSVQHGAAEWVVDNQTGKTTFKFKTNPEKDPKQ